jgi:tetratricopeptide (TPR) repeat protein
MSDVPEDPQKVYTMLTGITKTVMSDSRDQEGEDSEASWALGKACMNDGDFEGGVMQLRKAVEQAEEDNAELLFDLGAALEACDNLEEALDEYEISMDLNPTSETALALAVVHKKLGPITAAIEWHMKAADLSENSPYIYFRLAEILHESGRRRDAAAAVAQALELNEDPDLDMLTWAAGLHLEMKDPAQAEVYADAGLEAQPAHAESQRLKGLALWQAGELEDSGRALRVAIEFDSQSTLASALLAEVLELQGHDENAAKERGKVDPYEAQKAVALIRRFKLKA